MDERDLAALFDAYRKTTYLVSLPTGPVSIRVGEAVKGLPLAVGAWAVITGANPGSVQLDDEENDFRNSELESWLENRGYRVFPSMAVADEGVWPDESGFWVLEIGLDAALEVARQFGQVAIVAPGADGLPSLQVVD